MLITIKNKTSAPGDPGLYYLISKIQKMYLLIESAPDNTERIIGHYDTLEEAQNAMLEAYPVGECFYDFYVAHIVSM